MFLFLFRTYKKDALQVTQKGRQRFQSKIGRAEIEGRNIGVAFMKKKEENIVFSKNMDIVSFFKLFIRGHDHGIRRCESRVVTSEKQVIRDKLKVTI